MILLFDMGGVVASSNCTSNICKELSITLEELLFFQLDKSGRNTYLQLTTGALSTSEYWNNFSLNSGIDISCDYFYKCYEPQVDDKVIDFIKFLKKKDIVSSVGQTQSIVIIENIWIWGHILF